jgi:hypothetical protein
VVTGLFDFCVVVWLELGFSGFVLVMPPLYQVVANLVPSEYLTAFVLLAFLLTCFLSCVLCWLWLALWLVYSIWIDFSVWSIAGSGVLLTGFN